MEISRVAAEAVTLSNEMAHPNANTVWARALETFGDESKALHWMNEPRDIFGGRYPRQLVATGDPSEQRTVLTALIRIDYGVYS